MTYIIFALVMIILAGIARLMKLTYNTINILVYPKIRNYHPIHD